MGDTTPIGPIAPMSLARHLPSRRALLMQDQCRRGRETNPRPCYLIARGTESYSQPKWRSEKWPFSGGALRGLEPGTRWLRGSRSRYDRQLLLFPPRRRKPTVRNRPVPPVPLGASSGRSCGRLRHVQQRNVRFADSEPFGAGPILKACHSAF